MFVFSTLLKPGNLRVLVSFDSLHHIFISHRSNIGILMNQVLDCSESMPTLHSTNRERRSNFRISSDFADAAL